MARVLLLNKPFGVLSTFTDSEGRATLADFIDVPGVYAAGRLDRDSEGLLVLTDDGVLQHRISHPGHGKEKGYWVQIEGAIDETALAQLRVGVVIKGQKTRPARARVIETPEIWLRHPPVRFRKTIPTCWLELYLQEGMNRQVRRMTAAVGHPTLRLVRFQVGAYSLGELAPGEWCESGVG
jgi:23S rRNA pseudouridine2457 synthase